MKSNSPSAARPALFWLLLPFALGYGASYFFRNVNAVAGPELAREFSLGPSGLGFLTSAYFLAFSLAQIPLGMALDRFGPSRVGAVMLTIMSLGAVVFGCADDVAALAVGRALIGLGAGVALMAVMSAVHLLMPRERAATYIGFAMILGGLGAMFASTPTQIAINAYGWRAVFFALSVFAAVVAVYDLWTGRHLPPVAATQTFRELAGGVARIFAAAVFWRITLATTATLGTMLAFQTLWAATWMRDVAGFEDRIAIGNVLFALNLGMTLAFLLGGLIADTLAKRGVAALTTLKAYIALAILGQVWLMAVPTFAPHLAWGLFAFGANALTLSFTLLAAQFPPAMTGRVNTSVNLLAFSSAFALQWAMGAVLAQWPVTERGYAVQGYYWSWGVLLAVQLVAFAYLAMPGHRGLRLGAAR
ncbi:MAG: nitrate/nitrite transporter [Burkholderiales bacterium]